MKRQLDGKMGDQNWMLKNPLMTTIKLSRFKFASKLISKKDSLLDIGCGQGLSSIFFSDYCKYVYGVDLLSDFLHHDRKNIKFIKKNIFQLKKNNFKHKINLITLIDFIEHFNKSQGSLILSKCSKLLEKKGGTLIVGTPSVYSSEYRSKRSRIQHIHEYDGMELKDLCSKYFNRTFLFSMNDEVVHTGFYKLAWFNFVVCVK
jgi:2-polyprenyl-3-methyl-5-hydroxy-6-metoxy-1,4-benzoquinol methylase